MEKKNLKIAKFVLDKNQSSKILGGDTPIPPPPPGGDMIFDPKPLDCPCDCSCSSTASSGCINGTGTRTGPA